VSGITRVRCDQVSPVLGDVEANAALVVASVERALTDRVDVLVCYDMEFPEMPRMLALAGADLIAVPTNWPVGEHPERDRVAEVIAAQATARGNGVFIACCDRAGTERGQDWNEASVIVDQFGWVVAEAPTAAGSTAVTADVFPTLARDKSTSPHNDWLGDRRPALYEREVPRA